MVDLLVTAGVYGVAIPALVAGLILVAAWRPWRESAPEHSSWGGALAVLAGFHVGYIALNWKAGAVGESLAGMVGEPKQMGFAVVLAAVVGLVESLVERPAWLRHALFAVALAGVAVLASTFALGDPWVAGDLAVRVGAVVVAVGAWSWTLERTGREHPGATVPLVLVVVGTGGALLLWFAATGRVAQHIGVLTATAGAAVGVAWWRGAFRMAGPGIRMFFVLFATLYVYGYLSSYSSSVTASVALAAAPHALWLQHAPPLDRLEGWKATLARVMFVLVAVAAAVLVASASGGGSSYGY